jgi:hypothetical protein
VNRRWRNGTALAALGVLGVALSVGPPARAATAAELATVSGQLPSVSTTASAATLYLEGVPDQTNASVGSSSQDVLLATEQVTSGTAFALPIPDSAVAEALVSPNTGTINFHIIAVSSSGTSDTYSTVTASTSTPGSDNMGTLAAYQQTASTGSNTSNAASLSPNASASPDANGCSWVTLERTDDWATRIGEMHVIGGTGVKVTATYTYEQQADSEFSVGVSEDGGTSFSASGTITLTNTTDTTATETEGPNYIKYIDAHFDYALQDYIGDCLGAGEERVIPAAWDGDVIQGSNQPAGNPYGGCTNDPNGYSELQANGTFKHYSSTGVQYDTVANVYGFNFSGHTGYSSTNGFEYDNPAGGVTVYLCSTVSPVSSWHVIYNTLG